MEETTLTRAEISDLNAELFGVQFNDGKTIKGLLNEELDAKNKYWIGRLGAFVAKESKKVNDELEELRKKYGTLNEDKTRYEFGENFDKFTEQYNALIQIEVPVKHATFNVDDFTYTSDRYYPIFDKLKKEPI